MKRTRIRPPLDEHLKFLSVFEPRITELVLALRRLVLEEAPEASELVYDAYNAVASGYSLTGRPSDAFIHLAAYAQWVNLGFNHGSALADPDGLLKGDGKSVRHLRIDEPADANKRAVRSLVRSAVAQAERPRGKVEPVSVVRAIYPKKRRPA